MDAEDNLSTEPCVACSWSPELQSHTRYKSDIKLFYGASNWGYWNLGSRYILKDRSLRPSHTDPENHAFVQKNTTIPVPKILAFWEEPEDKCITIEGRIDGSTLEDLWPTLSEPERHGIARQTADYLKQLRGLQSDKVQGINAAPVYNGFLFQDPKRPNGPFETQDAMWEAISAPLKEVALPDKAVSYLHEHMPASEPRTFTHGKLHYSLIIVKDKKVVGITDWAGSGFLPCWAEYALATIGEEEGDREWRRILSG